MANVRRLGTHIFHVAAMHLFGYGCQHVHTQSHADTISITLALGMFLLALTGPLAFGWLTQVGCAPFSIDDASAPYLRTKRIHLSPI